MFENFKDNMEKKAASMVVSGFVKNYADENCTDEQSRKQMYDVANMLCRVVKRNYGTFKTVMKFFVVVKTSVLSNVDDHDKELVVKLFTTLKDILENRLKKPKEKDMGSGSETDG